MEPGKHNNKVHHVLAHSYMIYFVAFLLGLLLEFIFPAKIFKQMAVAPLGVTLLFLGTLLIFWAQHTSRHFHKENLTKEAFCKGPYCYTRMPTQWGLFFLLLGFGLVINAMFVVIFTVLSFFISRFTLFSQQEKILAEKYGAPYLEYQKAVKF